MNLFNPFSTLDSIYSRQTHFLTNYISLFTENVQKQVAEELDAGVSKEATIYKFPENKKNPYSKNCNLTGNDVIFCDFPHHKTMDEKEYRSNAEKELVLNFKEIMRDYENNIFTIKHVLPRYIKRYHRYIDKYLTLLEHPSLQISATKKVKYTKEENVISPFVFSDQKKERDLIYTTIQEMENSWEKERMELVRGLTNMEIRTTKIEKDHQFFSYVFPEIGQSEAGANASNSGPKEDITNLIQFINVMDIAAYKRESQEFIQLEHEKIKKFLSKK